MEEKKAKKKKTKKIWNEFFAFVIELQARRVFIPGFLSSMVHI